MMDTPYSANTSLVQEKIAAMQSGGADTLHVLADFDRTLTKGFYEGKPVSSIASFLYEDGTMCMEYQAAGKALFNHYYAIEQDPNIDRITKKAAMDERRRKHLAMLIDYKLSINDIEKIIMRKELQLRASTENFFDILATYQIPSVIMSASGIGYDSIGLFLAKNGIDQQYIHIISNAFIRDEAGYAIGRKDPIIHSMNKNEICIHAFPRIYEKVATRKNVILLGDSLHDIEMIDGFDYDTMVSIGFCLSEKKEVFDLFMQTYDVVIFDDGDMSYPVEMLEQILQ